MCSTTAEEWTKVADAVERRKIQNRNAQRKYRNNLKKKIEKIERNGAFIAFVNGTKPYGPLSSREVGHLMSKQNTQTLNKILNSHESQVPVQLHSMNSSPKSSYLTPPPGIESGTSKAESLHSPPQTALVDQGNYIATQDQVFMGLDTQNLPNVSAAKLWNDVQNMSFLGVISDESMSFNAQIFTAENTMSGNDDPTTVTTTTTSPRSEVTEESQLSAEARHSSASMSPAESSILCRSSISAEQCSRKASVDESDIRGRTPLHLAAARGYLEIVHLLVRKGIDVDVKDDQGWTALHIAAEGGHQAIVQVLLDAGTSLHDKGC